MALLQVATLVVFCLLVAASFALGAFLGRTRSAPPLAPPPSQLEREPRLGNFARGTFGAIDSIQGNVIRVRDPRSGRVWRVRAKQDTVIEFGRQRRIPFENLRVGQRIFVVGAPNPLEAENEFDAQFIGVVLGQQQRFVRPVGGAVEMGD